MRTRRQKGGVQQAARLTVQRRHRPDVLLIVYVALMMLIGLIFMYAIGPQRVATINASSGADLSDMFFVGKQLFSLVLALGALITMAIIPLEWVRKYAGKVLLAGFAACLLLMIVGNILHIEALASPILGAWRWFTIPGLGTFQPSELLKLGLLVFMARFLAHAVTQGRINSWSDSLGPALGMLGLALLLVVVVQKDLGTGLAMVSIVMAMFIVAKVSWRNIGILLAGFLAAGVAMILAAPHRISRVMTFLQGDTLTAEQLNAGGYHVQQAKIALGSGGFSGVGIGNSVQSTGYLPEAINDSMFAIMGETFGFIGVVALLLLLSALLLRILRIADRLATPWMQLLAAGVFGWLLAHIVMNIASMIGLAPLTGITLPLLSFGGTSMIFISAALGIVFSLSRYTSHVPLVEKEEVHANTHRGRRVGRTRYASRRRS